MTNAGTTNAGTVSLDWAAGSGSPWLSVSSGTGTLAVGGAAATVGVSLNSAATLLAAGTNAGTVWFTNLNNGVVQSFLFSLTVTKLAPSLSWAALSAVSYGTALSSTQLDATANVPGSFAYTPSAGTVLNAGTNTLSVVFTPTNTADYSNATKNVSLVVTRMPLTVTAANASRVYGQTNPVFTGTITGLQNGDNITATYSSSATTNSAVGTYAITPTLVDPNDRQTNYIVTLSNGTLTVTMAAPVLNWTTPPAITYGTALSPAQLERHGECAWQFCL